MFFKHTQNTARLFFVSFAARLKLFVLMLRHFHCRFDIRHIGVIPLKSLETRHKQNITVKLYLNIESRAVAAVREEILSRQCYSSIVFFLKITDEVWSMRIIGTLSL